MRILGGLGMAVILSGCVVAIGSGSKHYKPEPREESPLVLVPSGTEDSVVIAEIDAAGRLTLEAGRVDALSRVATRPELSPPAQVHLVNTALRRLDLEASRVGVILALIENPALSSMTAEAIYRQIDRFQLEASRQQVISTLQARTHSHP